MLAGICFSHMLNRSCVWCNDTFFFIIMENLHSILVEYWETHWSFQARASSAHFSCLIVFVFFPPTCNVVFSPETSYIRCSFDSETIFYVIAELFCWNTLSSCRVIFVWITSLLFHFPVLSFSCSKPDFKISRFFQIGIISLPLKSGFPFLLNHDWHSALDYCFSKSVFSSCTCLKNISRISMSFFRPL